MASRDSNYRGYNQRVSRRMTGLHIAACFGLRESMMALLKNKHNPDLKDVDGRTSLYYAAENGHEAALKLLLGKGPEPEFKDVRSI
jgi:ankyrin repeat protein